MDIVTHIAIGTIIGDVMLGKKTGKRAFLFGAIGAIIPDLDLLVYPFLEPTQALLFHRGITHSLFFVVLISPIIGWFISSYFSNDETIKPKHWALLIAIEGFIHIAIDLLTSYGTSVFWPFNTGRYSFSTIASVDVFFLLPLLFGMCWVLFAKRGTKIRIMITWLTLTLSMLYIPYTIINKAHANSVFENALHKQKKSFFQVKAYPQIPTNFKWLCIAKTNDGYWVGYLNQLKNESIHFQFVPRNTTLLGDLERNKKIKALIWFSKNEYSIQKNVNGSLQFTILRYGWHDSQIQSEPMFSFDINAQNNCVTVTKNKFHL